MKIGIITDIHEDAERLSIALKSIERYGCDTLFCLGDISGFDDRFYSYRYSKNFVYCFDLIRRNCSIIIPGNHDLFHLGKIPKYNNVFHYPDNWYSLDFASRREISKGLIWLYEKDYPIEHSPLFFEYMSDYRDQYIFEQDGISILLTHSIAPDISGCLTKKPIKATDFAEHFEMIKQSNCQIGISGHLHPNGLLRVEEKKIYSPKFAELELSSKSVQQYICPCIADGMQDNGFSILNTTERTIETIPLRTPKYNSFFL